MVVFGNFVRFLKIVGEWGLKVGIKFFYFVDLFNLWSRFEILDKLNILRSSLIKCIIVLIINI